MLAVGILFSLVLAFVLTIAVVRRWIEPACPTCEAKSWESAPALSCRRCGWSNLPRESVAA
jgi:ribosomal protein L40E